MKVLVTGGCGFIGSHVCEYYIKRGAKAIAYDNMTKHELTRTGYKAELARSYNEDFLRELGVTLLKEDVRDYSALESAAKECDFIVHTAAQPAVTISIEDPGLDFTTNAAGSFNLLEIVRKYKIPAVLCATIHVYGNKINEALGESDTRYLREPAAIDEEHPLAEGTLTPLHASKRAVDLYVKTYIDTYSLPLASFRLTGLYGERQFGGEDHGWVANFAIRTVLDEPVNIYGTGKQVRDILYASDVASAFDAFFKTRKAGIYNIGGGLKTSISLIECIGLLRKITGKTPKINFHSDRLGDLRYFICDISKAERELGWSPAVLPEEGIKRLVKWVEGNSEVFKGR